MDLGNKRDEFDLHIWVFLLPEWLGSVSAQPMPTAWLSGGKFSFPSYLSPSKKGPRRLALIFKDFSTLTGLADNPERKGSGDTAGLAVTALC